MSEKDFWEGYQPEPAQQKPVTRVNLDMTGAMATLPKTGSESVVEYKPVISDVGADSNIAGLPGTYYGIVPKGAGKITLHESKPAQQEPVAYLCENAVGHQYFRWKKPSSTYKPIALYTSPPSLSLAQRTWVGLTDEEIQTEWVLTPQNDRAEGIWFGRRIEAKLKEKNT